MHLTPPYKAAALASLALVLVLSPSTGTVAADQGAAATAASARSQSSQKNMTLLGNWNGRESQGGSSYGDIWGYTDTSTGREYALLTVMDSGLSIIDISADSLVEVGFFPSLQPGRDAKDVKVYEHYAILIKENEPAQIIDLADPANPDSVSIIHIGPPKLNGGAHNAFVQGQYLYTTGNHGVGGLIIYDLTDPAKPDSVGEYQTQYYHDFYARGDTGYAAALFGGGIDILDLTVKSNPQLIANINYPAPRSHNCWTSEDGNYLFVGDEGNPPGMWTRVFDVRDPFHVTQVADYIVDSLASVHNSYVRGDYLYVAYYTEGVRVVDVSDPTQPVEVAYYDTYLAEGYGFLGVWSVYPYFESGKIIASDVQTGLYVLEVDWVAVDTRPSADPLPSQIQLAQNFPNPFNAGTTLRYDLPQSGQVTLTVYDIAGRSVATLVNEVQTRGRHQASWAGEGVGSGVYLYRLRQGNLAVTRKLVILK